MRKNNKWNLTFPEAASEWIEALPLGNGHLGAMVYGEVQEETVELNLDTFWSGNGAYKGNTAQDHGMKSIKEDIMHGRLSQAEHDIKEKVLGDWTEAYMPLGKLTIRQEGISEVRRYSRSLSLEHAVLDCQYGTDEDSYRRQSFIDYDNDYFVMTYQAGKTSLNLDISFESQVQYQVGEEEEMLVIKGRAPSFAAPNYVNYEEPIRYDGDSIQFCARVFVQQEGGRIKLEHGHLIVEQAEKVSVFFVGDTDFEWKEKDSLEAVCARKAEQIRNQDLQSMKEAHQSVFSGYFNRVELDLEDKRLSEMFQYGRYLLISSSKPGTKCANLQGIWNPSLRAPWSSNYTVNINAQMNYWMAETCNLSEFHEPLFRLLKRAAEQGKRTARELYQADGFVLHHNIDIWGHSTPVGHNSPEENPCMYGFFNMSGGWLCQHLWEHYCFTGDKKFLEEEAYPLMREAVLFYLDYLTEYKDYLVTVPSTSPENTFVGTDGNVHGVSFSSTMDNAVLRELFSNFIQICIICDKEDQAAAKAEEALQRLPSYQIGKDGALQEWFCDYEEVDVHHRHVSHLYGMYPGNDRDIYQSESLKKAVEKSLLKRGDEGTGWSLAWKAGLWARLGNGNKAAALLEQQLRPVRTTNIQMTGGGTYPNLFCAHPPFQIDGNFGITAALTEMLLQSHQGYLELLPACPESWKQGTVCGLRGRGGFTVSFCWKEGKMNWIEIESDDREAFEVRFDGEIFNVKGKRFLWNKSM